MSRQHPNILVTGTPGTGKTELCKRLAVTTGTQVILLLVTMVTPTVTMVTQVILLLGLTIDTSLKLLLIF